MRKAYKPWTKIVIAMMSVFMFTIAILGSTAYASSAQQDVKEPKTTTPESENDECDWVDWDAVAAQAIGIDTDTLYEEWFANDNTSIADVAKAREVEPQKVIDAIVAAETEWLKQQVADGHLSQEDADLFSKETTSFAKEFVETAPVVSEGEMVDWDAVAAQAIGIDTDTLYEEWFANDDTSIADVAKARGIEPQQVIDAIVAAERELLNQEVKEGHLSQEDADQLLAEITPSVKEFVEMTLTAEGEWVDWDSVAAQALGIDTDTLYSELDTGTSIADVAKTRGIEPQQVIDAIVAAERELLNQEVKEGHLSQEDADQLLAEITPSVKEFVEMSLVEEEEVEE